MFPIGVPNMSIGKNDAPLYPQKYLLKLSVSLVRTVMFLAMASGNAPNMCAAVLSQGVCAGKLSAAEFCYCRRFMVWLEALSQIPSLA